ncbi:hypothetical protein Sviol_49330 [Streptomyces violascens]|uniref:Uncharacterized protein n=1 Tax=Streptomyces violascens TaxID=67381 RepID=A0ABQ3QTC4_9ACTN|nr:hypothetical protein Sviol_49330 [Streptomyces violascens]
MADDAAAMQRHARTLRAQRGRSRHCALRCVAVARLRIPLRTFQKARLDVMGAVALSAASPMSPEGSECGNGFDNDGEEADGAKEDCCGTAHEGFPLAVVVVEGWLGDWSKLPHDCSSRWMDTRRLPELWSLPGGEPAASVPARNRDHPT